VNWIRDIKEQPWRTTIAAVGGLLVAIIVAGMVGFLLNERVENAADDARYDVGLEDEGDDLRAAVLDMRHYHRNIAFTGISRGGIKDFEGAYRKLHEEIDELEDVGVRDPDAPQPDEIRAMANEYYEDFRPAMGLYEEDQPGGGAAFEDASDRGLYRIAKMESAAEELDELGEVLSNEALARVDRATARARVVLLAVVAGLLLVGAALAYAAVRVVNELRRLYAEQQVASEKLAEASQAKTDFIADVSHELRTPLTVLRGNAQVGLVLDGDCEHREILEEIVEESKRMSRMVEDLLFLARSDTASPQPLNLNNVAIDSFLAELAGRAEVLARERGARLETELEGGGFVEIDAQKIEQAVLALVDNAAKYGPPGGTVTLASSVRSGELHISVEDRGPGIPKEELPRIFERFYRLDKARSRQLGGAGLGLPITKTIVEAHGGHAEAVSRLGKGTKMSLCLPLLAGSSAHAKTARSVAEDRQ
jgi:two-component system, OmpR family, sensor histidine kinase VicK